MEAKVDELFLKNQTHHDKTSSNDESMKAFVKKFMAYDSSFRDTFLENSMTPEQKKVINDLNNALKHADDPSPTENKLIVNVRQAMQSKKERLQKGETVVLDKALKADLAMKAMLVSIFMVSVLWEDKIFILTESTLIIIRSFSSMEHVTSLANLWIRRMLQSVPLSSLGTFSETAHCKTQTQIKRVCLSCQLRPVMMEMCKVLDSAWKVRNFYYEPHLSPILPRSFLLFFPPPINNNRRG